MPADADSPCNVCNVAQWDDAHPVEQGWVTAWVHPGLLGDQKVSVYQRKCSDIRSNSHTYC